jgi:hypothetical protein
MSLGLWAIPPRLVAQHKVMVRPRSFDRASIASLGKGHLPDSRPDRDHSHLRFEAMPELSGRTSDIRDNGVEYRGSLKALPAPPLWRSAPHFVLLAIVIGCANNFADPDLWMHVLTGREIVHSGQIPTRDFYSYSAAGLLWRNHEWLAQAALALFYDELGVFGLKMLKLGCVAIGTLALAGGISRTRAPLRVQRLVLLAAISGCLGQIQFRPQLFTFAFLSILMAALAREVYQRPARLWLLVPLFALWSNLHGGFIVGLAALSVFSITSFVREWWTERRMSRSAQITLIATACGLATLLNPFGLQLWFNVFHSVLDQPIKGVIADWVSLPTIILYDLNVAPLGLLEYVVPIGLFLVFAVLLFAYPETDDAPLVVISVVFIAAAIFSARNIAFAVVALTIPMARRFGLALEKRDSTGGTYEEAAPVSPVLVLLAALLIAVTAGEFSNRLKPWEPLPAGAVAFMQEHRLHGNVLNDLGWGGYLAWHGYPQSRIFIDGRCELVYSDSLLRDYFHFLYGQPDGAGLLDRYPHDFVLVMPDSGAYRLTAANPGWKIVYRDSVAVLFARAGSPLPAVRTESHVTEPRELSEFP